MKFNCKIYLEAEDVSQSRILSTTSYVKNLFGNAENPYIAGLQLEDESDMEDFVVRLYLEADIEEETKDAETAKMLAPQLAELLTEIAQSQSYLDMEGSFSVSYEEQEERYKFASSGGDSFCDFFEEE